MTGILPQTLPEVVVERMLNGALEGMVLAGLAWVLLKAVGRRTPSTRFAVWFVVLLTMGALPWMGSLRWGTAAIFAPSSKSAILIPGSWAAGMFYVWAAVALLSLARVALGLWQIRCLRRSSAQLDAAGMDPALREVLEASCKRPISLYVSPSVRVPMATGFFRPMIVIPAWALSELSTDELKVVLLHEAAHLERWDDWTNLTQKVLRAPFFFHPVVWWVESKLALEREMACDDLVVAATSSPRAYAECLVSLAEKSSGRRAFALAQAAVNRMRHTSLRIRQILDGNHPGTTAVWTPAVGFAATAAMACLLLVNNAPKLVGFASPPSTVQGAPAAAAETFGPPQPSASLFKVTGFKATGGLNSTGLNSTGLSRTGLAVSPARRGVSKRAVAPPASQWTANRTEGPGVVPPQMADRLPVEAAASGAPYRSVAFSAERTVFVVLEDQQFNAAGDKIVRFNVYRFTVFYPEFYPSNPQKTLSKSI
jgi:beta-lactamase regulating signal transducer with metallopeptidase domain